MATPPRRAVRFRPCIDIHDGAVKQIVGGTLKDGASDAAGGGGGGGAAGPLTNFVSAQPAAHFAALYRARGLSGGHVIKLGGGPANEAAALSALAAFPGGLQLGGGVTPANAAAYVSAGASAVIVTSYAFVGGALDFGRLAELRDAAGGRERLVLDLSCRRRAPPPAAPPGAPAEYVVVTDRWQTWTSTALTPAVLASLGGAVGELLVHGVDVEGTRAGVEDDLVALLAESPVPVTYAGGVRDLADVERVAALGRGRVDVSIGSALDIFGGTLKFDDVCVWHEAQVAAAAAAAAAAAGAGEEAATAKGGGGVEAAAGAAVDAPGDDDGGGAR